MPKKIKNIARTATEAIKNLWASGFLREWRKVNEFEARFAKDHYHFSSAELGMALKRAGYLTRRGSRGKYEYVQKHPFIDAKEE
jgi:hypothetical protein